MVWRYRIYDYFREIFKFRDFMNTFKKFREICFAGIFVKFEYFAKVIIYSKSPENFVWYVERSSWAAINPKSYQLTAFALITRLLYMNFPSSEHRFF